MWIYVFKRLLLMIPTLLGVITLNFAIMQFVPGGPVEQTLTTLDNEGRSPDGSSGAGVVLNYVGRRGMNTQQVDDLKKLYGFDRPPLARYLQMIGNFLQFNLGYSFFHHQGVWDLVKSRLPVSISLGMWTFFLTYLVSVPLGVSKAIRAGSRFDFVTTLLILTGYAIPGFALGVLLIVLFGGGAFWDLFPLRGLTSDDWSQLTLGGKAADYLWHIALPVTASTVGHFAILTMLTKNTFLDQIRRQYVLTARAKGLPERQVLWKHVFRNALVPIVTGFPEAFIAAFFTSSLLIETLFSLNGIGLLSFEAVNSRDYPVVLGALYLFTLIGIFIKLIGDLLYVLADPRINFDSQGA